MTDSLSALSPSGAGDAPTPLVQSLLDQPFDDAERGILRRWAEKIVNGVGLRSTPDKEQHARSLLRYEAALTAARAARDRAEQEREALREVDAAQTALLACYRTGNHRRADAALTRLEAARAKLAALSAPDSLAGAPVLAVDPEGREPTCES